MEVAPGIHRIESVLGPRPFSQYLLRDERSLLVDTGVKETPAEVILPFLDGLQPDFVLNSHADVDHYGGNAAIREAAPEALFLRARARCSAGSRAPRRSCASATAGTRRTASAYEPERLRLAARRDRARTCRSTSTCRAASTSGSGRSSRSRCSTCPATRPATSALWDPASRTAIVIDAGHGSRPPRHGGQRDPPAPLLRRRRLPRRRADAAGPPARTPADGALRRDRGRGGRPLPRRDARVRRGRASASSKPRSPRRAS